jgi:ParB-like chromosome segregation protein Spo0J
MKQLRVADLLANSSIDPESHLNPTQVERYAQMLEALPPVVVFDTPEGLLVVDGYHRLAAVRRCGLETVEAEVRSGTGHEALQYAARVVAAQRGISPEEVASYIVERYAHDRRPGGRAGEGGLEITKLAFLSGSNPPSPTSGRPPG